MLLLRQQQVLYTILAFPTMDSFSFLKYWRRSSDTTDTVAAPPPPPPPPPPPAAVFTEDNSVDTTAADTDSKEKGQETQDQGNDSCDQDDDGSFFDLEFTLPEDLAAGEKSGEISENTSSSEENENLGEQQDIVINEDGLRAMETIEADTKLNASGVLKSATKLGVLMFKLKKCKSNVNEKSIKSEAEEESNNLEKPEGKKCKEKTNNEKHKFFTVNLKAEEVPVLSLFTRDFSSKGESKKNSAHVENNADSNQCSSPDKKNGKDVVNKYLKKVKPLYIRVSKRYGEKLGFSLHLTEPEKTVSPKSAGETVAAGVEQNNLKSLKQVNLQAGLRLVYKQLGKSQSASSSATVSAVPAAPTAVSRRDDSLLQHEDGIQSAILHCKRSFNASQRYEGTHLEEQTV